MRELVKIAAILTAVRLGRSFASENATRLLCELPANCIPVVVIGSASFDHDDNGMMMRACQILGRMLRDLPNVFLLTGGMPGVGRTVGQAFVERDLTSDARMLHILPKNHGMKLPEIGETRFFGKTFRERQEILGTASRLNIVIGGGPGTVREANTTLETGGIVLPIVCTGGAAAGQGFDMDDLKDAQIDFKEVKERAQQLLPPHHLEALFNPNGRPERAVRIIITALSTI